MDDNEIGKTLYDEGSEYIGVQVYGKKDQTEITTNGSVVHRGYSDCIMPSGGLPSLAVDLWPEDREDATKMAAHLALLLTLNSDTLKDATVFQARQLVHIPEGM